MIYFVIEIGIRDNTALGPVEEGPVCVTYLNNAQRQETPVGSQRGARRSASYSVRRGHRQTHIPIIA